VAKGLARLEPIVGADGDALLTDIVKFKRLKTYLCALLLTFLRLHSTSLLQLGAIRREVVLKERAAVVIRKNPRTEAPGRSVHASGI
jgi:hypothetical protein